MLTSILIAPSMNGLILTGLFMLIIFMIFIKNYSKFLKLNLYQQIVIFCLLILVIGVHSILNLGAEIAYGFNPYKWFC